MLTILGYYYYTTSVSYKGNIYNFNIEILFATAILHTKGVSTLMPDV